ncbi:hypothetical protein STEG23_038432, partial [Scotinomys teguina]
HLDSTCLTCLIDPHNPHGLCDVPQELPLSHCVSPQDLCQLAVNPPSRIFQRKPSQTSSSSLLGIHDLDNFDDCGPAVWYDILQLVQ